MSRVTDTWGWRYLTLTSLQRAVAKLAPLTICGALVYIVHLECVLSKLSSYKNTAQLWSHLQMWEKETKHEMNIIDRYHWFYSPWSTPAFPINHLHLFLFSAIVLNFSQPSFIKLSTAQSINTVLVCHTSLFSPVSLLNILLVSSVTTCYAQLNLLILILSIKFNSWIILFSSLYHFLRSHFSKIGPRICPSLKYSQNFLIISNKTPCS